MAQPCVALTTAERPGGRTFVGGRPIAPGGVPWPATASGPLPFIAQVDFAECAGSDVARLSLPEKGILLLFCDEANPDGFDPEVGRGWAVVFAAEPGGAREVVPPEGLSPVFNKRHLRASIGLTFPDPDDEDLLAFMPHWSDTKTWDAYDGYRWAQDRRLFGADYRHQLRGFALWMEEAARLRAEMASRGINTLNADAYQKARTPEIEKAAKDWRLLWQIDTDQGAGFSWGDLDPLYLLIRENDLRRRDFSRLQLTIQGP